MKIFELNKANRWNGKVETALYMSEAKANKEAETINAIYAEAKAKGSGEHWGKIIYERAWVKPVEVIE